MLYYRMRKSKQIRSTGTRIVILFFIFIAWLSWFVSEVPVRTLLPQIYTYPAKVVSKGSIVISSSDHDKKIDNTFKEPALGVLTSPFGERWGRVHEGIDIGGEHGSDVLAAKSGIVLLSQWVDGYGNYIKIDHGNGLVTAYGHCDELLVDCGDVVAKGQTIATMGNTGNSTGTHLHFEVLLHGEPQNPLDYVIY